MRCTSPSIRSLTLTKLLSRSYAYQRPTLRFVSSVLRAADALEFDEFRAFAISYLEEMWTDDLSELGDHLDNAADTLLLARRCNVNSILKRALYELVISEGFKQSTSADPIDPDVEDVSILDPSDVLLLVNTREKLTMFWMQKAVPPPAAATCWSSRDSPAHQACAVTRHMTHELYKMLVHDSKLFECYRHDPISGLQGLCNAPWIKGEVWSQEELLLPSNDVGYLCSTCAKKWRAIWQAEKTILWHDMNMWLELHNEESEGDSEESSEE